jgi:hypothetical protein
MNEEFTQLGLVGAMMTVIGVLFRHLLAAKDETIKTLARELTISQQREEAWKAAAFDSLPILAKQSEVAAEAVGLAKKRGAT